MHIVAYVRDFMREVGFILLCWTIGIVVICGLQLVINGASIAHSLKNNFNIPMIAMITYSLHVGLRASAGGRLKTLPISIFRIFIFLVSLFIYAVLNGLNYMNFRAVGEKHIDFVILCGAMLVLMTLVIICIPNNRLKS